MFQTRSSAAVIAKALATAFILVMLVCSNAPLASDQVQQVSKAVEQSSGKKSVDAVPVPGGKAAPNETETLEAAGKKMEEGVGVFSQKVASLLGPWVNVKLWRGISWLELLASISFLVLFFLIERLLSLWLSAMGRKVPVERGDLLWKKLLLNAIRPPISLIILLYGAYVSLYPLYGGFQDGKGKNLVYGVALSIANMGGTVAAIWLVYRLVRAADLFMQSRLTESPKLVEIVARRCRGPIQLLVALVLIRSLLPAIGGLPSLYSVMTNLLSLVFIGTVAWLVTQMVYVASDYFVSAYKLKGRNQFYVRKLHTQVLFLRRLALMLIILVAIASSMMIFDKVRQLGTSILASAGIAGVIVGFSAQRTLANLLVGLQIAITQPIRIGDIVTVDKETGTIQEINSTFAIIQTWDQRSLIVPLTYFTEKHFQNLTLSSSELLGTVTIHVDYSVPVDAIRSELHRIVQQSSHWDGRSWALNVADLKENSVELTAQVSASDSASLGNLRGEVREKLLAYLQKNFPEGLPRLRAELDIGGGNRPGGNGGLLKPTRV